MDGLDDFEKSLAAEKAERERDKEKKHRKHRHHRKDPSAERDRDGHRHRHHRHRSHDRDNDRDDADGHRHKRSRHSRDDDDSHRHSSKEHSRREHRDKGDRERDSAKGNSHLKASDVKEDLPLPDEEITAGDFEKPASSSKTLVRDSWMTDPSAIDIDYVHRGAKQSKSEPPPKQQQPKRDIHAREINAAELQALNDGKSLDHLDVPAQHEVDYKFGDSGSQWRMTKLNGVYRTAEETSRPVEEVAEERYGSLREFDDAREEKIEIDRRKVYGEGYVGKEKPSGELFQERKLDMNVHEKRGASMEQTGLDQGTVIPDDPSSTHAPTTQIDQTTLNHLRARMMKAKLKKAPDAAKLEADYDQAAAAFKAQGPPSAVVLNVMENRMLAGTTRAEAKAIDTKRGRERGLVEENDEMSIEDMVREERRTRGQGQGQGGDGLRLAERIAKDAKFDNDLEYMDENAEKLARRVQKSELSLKNAAVGEFQKINRILDSCPLCFHEDDSSKSEHQQQPVAPVVSLGTRLYLTLPTEPELADGGAVLVPLQHRTNLLECDDDEWEELRNFMKCLTRMYHEQGREVVFYETAAARRRHPHAALQAVPIPWDLGATAPAFFREAMLAADEEWAQHRKVIDTGARVARDGKLAFRRSIAREAPYFHVWFSLDGGLGHVVEDEGRWPRGDLFAREVIGGMLDVMPDVIKKQGRWRRGEDAKRVDAFRKRWRKFDWTRVLTEGQ